MVVLAAAICSKAGKALLSRQFVEISRVRIEGFLAAFPKLVGTNDKQHTYIETDSIRYLYQPMETLYMVVITNKSSNILEDLETLHILAKLIPDYCRVLDEDEILKNCFELIFAFDEVIAAGYREKVSPQQIKTFTEMDSQEERVHEMFEKNKQREAQEEMKRRQHQIEKDRLESAKAGYRHSSNSSISMSGGGMGGGIGGGMGYEPPQATAPYVEPKYRDVPVEKPAPKTAKRGMVLQKPGQTNDFMKGLEADGEPVEQTSQSSARSAASEVSQVKKEGVHITLEEKLQLQQRDGGLERISITGELFITITDNNFASAAVQIEHDTDRSFQCAAHPNMDRNQYNNNLLMPKDQSRPFPTGPPLGILKWRLQTTDERYIPLSITCWPNAAGNGITVVNMQYELLKSHLVLKDTIISIPVPSGTAPTVEQVDGAYQYEQRNQVLNWTIDIIDDANNTGTMEFRTQYTGDSTGFFPISTSWVSETPMCQIKVVEVKMRASGKIVPFSVESHLIAEKYEVA